MQVRGIYVDVFLFSQERNPDQCFFGERTKLLLRLLEGLLGPAFFGYIPNARLHGLCLAFLIGPKHCRYQAEKLLPVVSGKLTEGRVAIDNLTGRSGENNSFLRGLEELSVPFLASTVAFLFGNSGFVAA